MTAPQDMTYQQRQELARIARCVISRSYTMRHALELTAKLIGAEDAWTPIEVLSAAILAELPS